VRIANRRRRHPDHLALPGQGVCLPLVLPSQVGGLLDSGIRDAMKRTIPVLSVRLAMAGATLRLTLGFEEVM
jgi:hypothetical protein